MTMKCTYTAHGFSPADDDVKLDEEQRVQGAAVLLFPGAQEVWRTLPWLCAEEHQDVFGEQGHL